MEMGLKRREILKGAAATAVASSLPFAREARAKDEITVVEWGPPYVDGTKKVAAKWDKADITYELHVGGAAAVLGKIKATWPNSGYDLIDNWAPTFPSFIREGWAETITMSDVPNLSDVPERFLTKDEKGNIKVIPRSVDGNYWAVRSDRCPIEIKTIEDFLNPKLKGMICWPHPINMLNAQTIMLALARGGNEFNMEPGWKFLDELAKSGNIGRVYKTATEMINSFTTGETCLTFNAQGSFALLGKQVPIKAFVKLDPSLKALVYVEGWVVMANSKNKKAAMDFANFTIGKENSELFNETVALFPTNPKAKALDSIPIQFSAQEFDKFAYIPDWNYVSAQVDGWVKRYEQDIAPNI
jgi:putative spermidine/putrescine transport system substrate-binding protein